jgi:hypothetical protein
MSAPSLVLDCIARTLDEEFSPPVPTIDQPRVDVMISDLLDEDVSQDQTFSAPAIVLSCLGLGDVSTDKGPGFYRAGYLARCYARVPQGPAAPADSSGDVAMDLAAVVAQIVDSTIWKDDVGQPVVSQRAERITVRNRTSKAALKEGASLWLVTWQQLLEFSPRDVAGLLHSFKHLHITIAMGDADTPDVEADIELPGGPPP